MARIFRPFKSKIVLYKLISRIALENLNEYEPQDTQKIIKPSDKLCVLHPGGVNENPFIALQFNLLDSIVRIDIDLTTRTDLKDVLKHIKLKRLNGNQFLISGFLGIGTNKFLFISKFDERLPDNIEFLEDDTDEIFVIPG